MNVSSELEPFASRRMTFAAAKTGQDIGSYVAQWVIGVPLSLFFCFSKVIVMQSALWRSGEECGIVILLWKNWKFLFLRGAVFLGSGPRTFKYSQLRMAQKRAMSTFSLRA